MKKIFILFLMLAVLSACAMYANTSTPTESGEWVSEEPTPDQDDTPAITAPTESGERGSEEPTPDQDDTPATTAPTESGERVSEGPAPDQDDTHVPSGDAPSYESVCGEIDAYFRMYYANNQDYKWNGVKATQNRAQDTFITGFFDGDSLVNMVLLEGGDYYSRVTTYYFIHEDLTYITFEANMGIWRESEYREYFFINQKLWQYDNQTGGLVESPDTDPIDYFEQDKHDLLGNQPLSIIKNTFTLPTENNVFTHFNKAKQLYFKSFFAEGNRYNRKLFQIVLPGYSELSHCSALFSGSDLFKLIVIPPSDEKSYAFYEYYLIDDALIYVVADIEEYESYKLDLSDHKKYYYSEYFIDDGNVMVYDPQVKDLVDAPEYDFVLKQYQKAMDEINKLWTAKTS